MPPDAVERWLTLLGLMAAALAGLLYLARQLWRGFKIVERVADVVQHELSPNTGSSMKDDVAAIARAVGQLQSDVTELTRDKDTAHAALQLQLDAITHELGTTPGAHKREGKHR
jgi:hypothetical protein